jgi:AAA domain
MTLTDEMKAEYRAKSIQQRQPEGLQSLHGIKSILEAAEKASRGSGYIVNHIIPRASFTLFSGPPKVGKTSILIAMLIRAFAGEEGVTGLKSRSFSHLTIYSDDQRPVDTARYLVAALQGLEDPEAAYEKLKNMPMVIYPKLTLDETGRDRLAEQALSNPGGVFVIDSLASTASKLGIDENSAEVGRVVYDLREAIQGADPTATVILIHHMKKGGPAASSPVDRIRGSSAIAGAPDNLLNIDRPTTGTDQDSVTPDRVLHLSGRNISESAIVVRSEFNYTSEYDIVAEEETYTLKTVRLEYLCQLKDYTIHKQPPEEKKAHRDWLTDDEYAIINSLAGKRKPQPVTSTDSLQQLLLQKPCLIKKVEDGYQLVSGYDKLLSARITDPNKDY